MQSNLRFKNSLFIKALIFFGAVFIPTLSLLAYLSISYYSEVESSSKNRLLQSLDEISRSHEDLVVRIHEILNTIYESGVVFNPNRDELESYLENIKNKNAFIDNLYFIGTDGDPIAVTSPESRQINFGKRMCFLDAKSSGHFSTGRFTLSEISNEPIFHYSIPVYKDNALYGVLELSVRLSFYTELYRNLKLPLNSFIRFYDRDGTRLITLFHANPPNLVGQPINDSFRARIMGSEPHGLFIRNSPIDSIKRFYAFKQLKLDGAAAPYMYLIVAIPYDPAILNARSVIIKASVLVSLLAFFPAILGIFLYKKFVISRFQMLVDLMRNFQGRAQCLLPTNFGDDEIGVLGKYFIDMTQKIAEQEERLINLSYTDELTGLFNRKRFNEDILSRIGLSSRYETVFCLAIFDIDFFKNVNDSYGHLIGDKILVLLSELARKELRNVDSLYRIGGEEFALIMHETSLEHAKVVVERIREKASGHVFKCKEYELKITISIGVAAYAKGMSRIKDLFKQADDALYTAKKSGRNRVVMYGSDAPE